ncbi:FG-GAP repeat domain-containing protein [Synoicihabitans lomoniglobus]|uniref:VCBS repeat-containing protein n=1 Tax=Synoicihabitans lomoniglobus TaxID=2909285 RepID=A0AAE9ZXT7_9BACT|nr:VCBS repeat-containing protein [Opitutaceae bacterium LMO-M01]WED64930.1 VCBS repeat-containing protein [Opitutaceae bacterium LMO-M01]
MKRRSPAVLPLVVGVVLGGAAGWFAIKSFAPKSIAPSAGAAPTATVPAIDLAYTPVAIGASVESLGRPTVTNVQAFDLDQDGRLDVLYCEASTNTVRWVRQIAGGQFVESTIGTQLPGPVHVWAADIYGNGRLDVLVACMGQVMPNNDPIGAVFVLENRDNTRFERRAILSDVARVTDVRAANLRGHADGRLDLIVGQFGYDQGETQWLENRGDWTFAGHNVNQQSGAIHTPVADFDGDGRPDFAALISQEWEEVHLFRNQGDGRFADEILWGSTNEDFGSSGMKVADLNRDGRPDLLVSNGDGFDYSVRGPRPWHGVQWLENRADGSFAYHHIGNMPGAFAPSPADLDGDGDIDLVVVSGFGDWSNTETVALMAWINDGREQFTAHPLALIPIQMITAATGDFDGDGIPEIVTGGYHAFPPHENMSNITLWRKN